MQFVESYRQYSRAPQVRRQRFAASEWAVTIARLFAATGAGGHADLRITVTPAELRIEGDPELLCQVVLNLLKNGAEAAAGARDDLFLPFLTTKPPAPWVSASRARSPSRTAVRSGSTTAAPALRSLCARQTAADPAGPTAAASGSTSSARWSNL